MSPAASLPASGATTTSAAVATTVSGTTSVVITTTSTTTSTTTTTTLPSAVTTLPEGCPSQSITQAVFVGTVRDITSMEVTYDVVQVRTGSVDNYLVNGALPVIYGTDAKFLTVGESYLVGVITDPTSARLMSSVTEKPEYFGGAEIAGANSAGCPRFENPARTLRVDGTTIDAGVLSELADSPSRLAFAVIAPFVMVFGALILVRRYRRRLL